MAWWNPAPRSKEPEEIAEKVQTTVGAESADLANLVASLNEFARNLWQIDWCGQFHDLGKGEGEFSAKIRRLICEDNEMAGSAVILQDMIGEFLAFITDPCSVSAIDEET